MAKNRFWQRHMVFKKSVSLLNAVVLMATLVLTGLPSVAHATAISDDFGTDSGQWSYVGAAYRDSGQSNVVLTENSLAQVGQIWLNQEMTGPFVARFRYKIGGGLNGGADGLVFMFNKQTGYDPQNGGALGFTAKDPESPGWGWVPVPGYGVEFDGWMNGSESWDHIALIEDSQWNHLASVDDLRVEDDQWHDVEVRVGEYSVDVYVDDGQVLHWTGFIDRTYGGMGFSASTGAAANKHIIDDVVIEPLSAQIQVSPSAHDFGWVQTDTSATKTFTVKNVGALGLNNISAAIGAGSSPAFSVTQAPAASLAPGATTDIEVTFAPPTGGSHSGTLEIASDDPDEPLVQVSLSGAGVVSDPLGIQRIRDILAFYDESMANGTLAGSGPGSSAKGRAKALRNMIEAAGDLLAAGDTETACDQLKDAYARTDGQPNPPDFVTGEAADDLARMIEDLRASLNCD